MNEMVPYRFNAFEMELFRSLTDKVFLKPVKSDLIIPPEFSIDRYPIIYWGDFDKSKKKIHEHRIDEYHEWECEFEEYFRDDIGKYDIDLLGCYIIPSNYNEEGYIEIYGDRINECAKSISASLKLDFNETRSLLQTKVLIHEIGHWFSHACFRNNRDHRMKSFTKQSRSIKETIAQLTVKWAIAVSSGYRVEQMDKIMDHLTSNQSRPYKQYRYLEVPLTQTKRILNRYIKLLDIENYDLNFLLFRTDKPNPYKKL